MRPIDADSLKPDMIHEYNTFPAAPQYGTLQRVLGVSMEQIAKAPTIELHPEGATDGRRKEIKLEKRSMNEMISHFNRTVSEMDMSMPDKMTLLGIVTAIYQRYCEDTQQLGMETIKEGIEKQ